MPFRLFTIALIFSVFSASAFGQTTFNGSSVFTPSNWTNGLPSVGNPGTIATNGNFTGIFDFNQNTVGTVNINITAGTLTSAGSNFYNGPVNNSTGWSIFNWTQSGGTVDLGGSAGTLSPNLRTTYNLTGGSVVATGQSSRIQPFNGGRFNQSGGSVSNLSYEFTDNINPFGMRTHTLSGGTATNVFRFSTSTNNTAIIDGSFNVTFSPTVSTGNISTFNTGIMNFQDSWTGFWTRDNFTATDWQEIFTRTGMQYEGTQITTANFATTFSIYNPGLPGSTISIVPVPEPGSVTGCILMAVGIGAVARRRFKFQLGDGSARNIKPTADEIMPGLATRPGGEVVAIA